MKRLLILFGLFLPVCAIATDMCARDDTMVLVFDAHVAGSGGTLNESEWTWVASYAYGRIQGEATCISSQEYQNANIQSGLSGTDANGNPRGSCFCKMLHPVMSGWVGTSAWDTDGCIRNCRFSCGQSAGSNLQFRQKMFNLIGV